LEVESANFINKLNSSFRVILFQACLIGPPLTAHIEPDLFDRLDSTWIRPQDRGFHR